MDNDQTNKTGLVTRVYGAMLAVTTLGFAARIASKVLKRSQVSIDDLLIIWAYILTVGETGMFFYGNNPSQHDLIRDEIDLWIAVKDAGFGRHLATLSPSEVQAFGKRVANTIIAVVVLWYLAITLAGALICLPVKSHWDPHVPAHCGNQYTFDIIAPIPWILTDFAILIAPIPMVWRLHMAIRQRVALGALFLIGGLGPNILGDAVDLATWNILEAHVTVLCACLIASKPAFKALVPDEIISRISPYCSRLMVSLRSKRTSNDTPKAQPPVQYGSQSHLPTNRASYELLETPTPGSKTNPRGDDLYGRQIV
ncbi:MAG: hypothetical protein Q9226_003659 [Calogaya cf. arnoldii]